jgi:hypothetical protein
MDEIELVAQSLRKIADSITPVDAAPGRDFVGGHVESLTEAVMGMTAAIVQVADALYDIATALRDGQQPPL